MWEKGYRKKFDKRCKKEMQDMKRQIMEQLLANYGMPIPSPPSLPLDRSEELKADIRGLRELLQANKIREERRSISEMAVRDLRDRLETYSNSNS
ncbi:uncharacterized protein G2W53_018106 [Senna tora]|uniref:Uncharacterized protein n=1 Tax=Senna tora TaxID=362788 RepID=A0A834WL24_9FABA|nr:uncharacterized protein G2W53_018106 [Senna tora]